MLTLQEGIPNTGMESFSTIPPEDRFIDNTVCYILLILHILSDLPDDLAKLDEKYSL